MCGQIMRIQLSHRAAKMLAQALVVQNSLRKQWL